jgi:hypothetical protein
MYLVIHEHRRLDATRTIRAISRTFTDHAEADACAAQTAKDFKVRAWIYEVDEPPLLEVVANTNEAVIHAEYEK